MALDKLGVELIVEGLRSYQADLTAAAKATDDTGGALTKLGSAAKLGAAAGIGALAAGIAGVSAALIGAAERAAEFRRVLGQDFPTDQIADISDEVALLERRFEADLPSTLDAVRQVVNNGLAPDFQSAMDIITAGFESGLDVGQDFLDTLREYSPNFASLGFDADATLSLINRGLDAGARNADVVADAVKEFGILIREPATLEAVAALDAGIGSVVQRFQEGEIAGDEALTLITERLGQIEDPILRNQIGVELFGTKFEDMGERAILALGKVDEGLITSEGAAAAAGDRITSFGEIFPRIGDKITAGIAPLSEQLLGFVNDVWPSVEDAIDTGIQIATDFAAALGGSEEAAGRLPGPLQGVIAVIEGVQGAADAGRQAIDDFFNTPLGTEIQQGAQVVADYFSGPWQEDISRGVGVVQGKLDEIAASPWGQDVAAGAQVVQDKLAEVATYITGPWAGDFQRGVQVAQDKAAEFGRVVGPYLEPAQRGAERVADYMLNTFSSDFSRGAQIATDAIVNLPGNIASAWTQLTTDAGNAIEGVISAITDLGPRAASAGRAFIGNIWEGISGRIDQLISDARARLQGLTDLLPGSEPRDPESPLRGLGRRGVAFVENFGRPMLSELAALPSLLSPALSRLSDALAVGEQRAAPRTAVAPALLLPPPAPSISRSETYQYSPTYQGAPPSPVADFAAMRVMRRA